MLRPYEPGATCTTRPGLAVLKNAKSTAMTCADTFAVEGLGTYSA